MALKGKPNSVTTAIQDAEIRALQQEYVTSVGEDGTIVTELPWAPLIRRLDAEWREPKADPTLIKAKVAQFLKAVARGNYLNTALRTARISNQAFAHWSDMARKRQQPYALVFELLEEAEHVAESRMLSIIERAAIEDWRAAAWYLERKSPERWNANRINQKQTWNSGDPRLAGGSEPKQIDTQGAPLELLPALTEEAAE